MEFFGQIPNKAPNEKLVSRNKVQNREIEGRMRRLVVFACFSIAGSWLPDSWLLRRQQAPIVTGRTRFGAKLL